MITYKCKNCDGLETETSVCPVCGQRTELYSSVIYYCHHCNAPSFYETCPVCGEKCNPIGTDVRPVFARERLLIECLEGNPMKYAGKAVWNACNNTYYIDGEKHSVSFLKLKENKAEQVIKLLEQYENANKSYVDHDFENKWINSFLEVNDVRLNSITDEALNYIRTIANGFDATSMFVSFSGGKDSSVTSNLVRRALGTERIIHIYGDTTLEYPESKTYIQEFRTRFPNTPLLVAKNKDQKFDDLCEVVGPPSRVMRWCCTVFKTGAITKKIEQTFQGRTRILSFQGIRRNESLSRSKYDRDSRNSKIAKQVSSSPIIDWLDFDVWLYLLANKLPFNNAYRQGFSRVGCWCCPNNSGWSEYLSSIYRNEEYRKFHQRLYSFAQKVGKPDWQEYIDSGKWKARQGGNGLDYSKNAVVEFKPCAFDSNSYNFELSRPIDETLYTLFQPFGIINKELGNKRLNEVYVLDRKTGLPLLKLSGKIGTTLLRVSVVNQTGHFKSPKIAQSLIRNQITKFQTCIGCTYCQSVCRFNALHVRNADPGNVSHDSIIYTIDPTKCVGCLECVTHFESGCYRKKVLRIKKG